ncbi:MAG: DEAD/DEAH box helicase [Lewinellaceae bacterium]|nr:DEAD/DEAH box helicase [Phaeodactylibacter sp.]MCB9351275.1 DEAD/DEAH box helicase [Lewinellaceae bacterium]
MNEFRALGLSQPVVDAIETLGYESPTPIQTQAIPKLLKNDTDFIGVAQTGTGKTAAFGLPLVQMVDASLSETQALILAPTRELCLQLSRELGQFAQFQKGLRILPVYGGADIGKQIRELKKGIQIVAATPGRLRDLMRRRAVDISKIQYVVLDEADEMLNMGFKEEIDEILQATPESKLTWLFSATMPEEVRRISNQYMVKPFELSVGQPNTGNDDIDHQYVTVRPKDRYEALRRFLDYDSDLYGLVFCRTRRDAGELAEQLSRDGYRSDALHGDLSQAQRDRVMAGFRDRHLRVLVATDVAARGIDVDNITHVFHYNIPEDLNFYTHRSGRTGRAGRKGISMILAHPRDLTLIRRLEKRLKTQFSSVHIPSGKEIFEKRLMGFFQRLKDAEGHEAIEPMLPQLLQELEGISREDLIHRLASMTMSRSMKKHVNGTELNAKSKASRSNTKGVELFINIGNLDVDGKAGFLALICGQSRIPGSAVGKIDMNSKHTFFHVEEDSVEMVTRAFNGSQYQGRELRVNTSKSNSGQEKWKKKTFKKGKKKYQAVRG